MDSELGVEVYTVTRASIASKQILAKRMTAQLDGQLVVFRIGMRIWHVQPRPAR